MGPFVFGCHKLFNPISMQIFPSLPPMPGEKYLVGPNTSIISRGPTLLGVKAGPCVVVLLRKEKGVRAKERREASVGGVGMEKQSQRR